MSKDIQVKKGLLLVNLGTPSAPKPKQVRQFLRDFLSDPRVVDLPRWIWLPLLYAVIVPLRGFTAARTYQKIWTDQGSPLSLYSLALCKKLASIVDDNTHVELAMRYGAPSIESALKKLKDHHLDELIVIPMYPQYSATTTASIFDAVSDVLKGWSWVPRFRLINHYADHAPYIDALVSSIQAHLSTHGMPDKLLFSFHGIPKRYFDQGDPYYCYCHKTARLVAEKLQLEPEQWQLVFQSRFGREPWLEPYCDRVLQQLPDSGVTSVAVICPGFAVDCLETLEEIALTNKALFLAAGGQQFHYIPALNDSDAQVQVYYSLLTTE